MPRALCLPLTAVLLVLLAACGEGLSTDALARAGAGVDDDTTAAFRSFLAESYAEDMARDPLTASYRGIDSGNDRWNSVAEAFQAETRALAEARLLRLRSFDGAALDERDRLSRELFERSIERFLAQDAFRHHDPVITHHYGPHTAVPSALINIHQVASVADAEDYLARLRAVGAYFDEVIEQLAIRTRKELVLVDWMYPKIIEAARNVISGEPFEAGDPSALWADYRGKVAALAVDAATRQRLLAQGRTVGVVTHVEAIKERIETRIEVAPQGGGRSRVRVTAG